MDEWNRAKNRVESDVAERGCLTSLTRDYDLGKVLYTNDLAKGNRCPPNSGYLFPLSLNLLIDSRGLSVSQ